MSVRYSLGIGLACFASYLLTKEGLARVHSISPSDDVVGGIWAAIATAVAYQPSRRASIVAARDRAAGTALSFVLCFVYLLFLPFHGWGMALLIAIGTLVLTAAGHAEAVATAGVTTAVIMLAAALSPRAAWQQPLLRAVDTGAGIAVALAASSFSARNP